MTTTSAGSVRELWRYPVKSMLGEELDACEVTERGLTGDRAYALVDAESGKVASVKNPRKWARLFQCRAEFLGGSRDVRITMPDGTTLSAAEPEAAELLSTLFGRRATLETSTVEAPVLEELWLDGSPDGRAVTDETFAKGSPPGTFFDYGVVHLVTTATLGRLHELYPEGRFDSRRFRPNVLVQSENGDSGFVENAWIGKTVAIGDDVRIRVTDPCPRCVMTTLAQEDLPADAGILRTAARHNRLVGGEGRGPDGVYAASVGVYASVLRGGVVRRGDPLRVVET
jgi:uncharacterized protein YcbX